MIEANPRICVLAVHDRGTTPDVLGPLERAEGVDVCAVVATVDDALGSSDTATAEVLLVDLPGASALDVVDGVRRLREVSPDAKIVVRGASQDPATMAEALAAGACGAIEAEADVADAVRRAAAGELVLPSRHLAGVLSHLRDDGAASADADVLLRLTARETQILRALALGETPTQIAEQLSISTLTVQTHVKSILAKLGVHSKIEAVTLAWRSGLAPSPRPTSA